jgi:soluble lytic murein transglycosylase
MQVMPLTGTKVAELMKEKNFQSRQLLDPDPAIRIGAKYLQRLSSKFEDNLAMVAAGYNAGPHRVQSWVANFGNLDLDEWIEHIPFVETRNYVKKVLANINVYSQLYGGDKQLIKDLAGPLNTKIGKLASTKETWEEI